MAEYTSITGLPDLEEVTGNEYLLTTNESLESNRLQLLALAQYVNDATSALPETLKNKIIDDITNYVHANAVHHYGVAVQPIPKGSPVKLVFDSNDSKYKIGISSGTNEKIVGIAEENIAYGATGKYIMMGELTNFDTSAWSKGDELYLFNGLITNEKPEDGEIVNIGYVLESSTSGSILILNIQGAPAGKDILISTAGLSFYASTLQEAIEHFDSVDVDLQSQIPSIYRQDGEPDNPNNMEVWANTLENKLKIYRPDPVTAIMKWSDLVYNEDIFTNGMLDYPSLNSPLVIGNNTVLILELSDLTEKVSMEVLISVSNDEYMFTEKLVLQNNISGVKYTSYASIGDDIGSISIIHGDSALDFVFNSNIDGEINLKIIKI